MEKKMSVSQAIAMARKSVTDGYTWDDSLHAWIEDVPPAGMSVREYKSRRMACAAMRYLGYDGYDMYRAMDYLDDTGRWTDKVRLIAREIAL